MSLTLIIIIITGLISFQSFSNQTMKSQLILHPATVKNENQFYRLLTHGFIHADLSHLAINMYVLYMIGETIEHWFVNEIFGQVYGRIFFLLIYFGSIFFGSLPDYLKYQNSPHYSALGASGGTSGMIFTFILFNPWGWFIFPPLPGIILAVGYLFYSSYMSKKGTDNIGHSAHFWGAIFGLVSTVILLILFRPEYLDVIWYNLMQGPTKPSFF